MTTIVAYFAVAFGLSVVLTPLCRLIATRSGRVAKPKDDRWHKRPTALFGGVAIVLPTLALSLTLHPSLQLIELIGCAALIAACGFVDDLISLKPSTKLIAQITVASALLFFGYRLQWTESLVGDAMLTVLWIVGVTNALNLLDNMDGLCAGSALIAGGFVLIGHFSEVGASPQVLYLSALLGATFGFLIYNFNPASIFMGDTGSLFLGLNLAALSLMTKPDAGGKSDLLVSIAAPVLPLLLPIFDTMLVTTVRLLSKRRPSQGGRDHTSHRLVAVGLSERQTVVILWILAAAGGAISLLLHRRDPGWAIIATAAFVLAMIIFAVYLARVRVYENTDLSALKGDTFTPLVANFMHKRRVAEVLLDLCLIPLAYYAAYHLRFEGELLQANYHLFIESLPVIIAAQMSALFIVGGYRGMWRYFGMMDAVVFAKAVALGTVTSVLIILYAYRFENYSRTVFIIYAALLFPLLAGSRASFRLVGEFIIRRKAEGQRCVIYGTSGASLTTIREAFGTAVSVKMLGYIDDEPLHRRRRVGGYAVVGGYDDLLKIIQRGEVDYVVVNTPLIDMERLKNLEEACRTHDVELLRLQLHLQRTTAAS